MENDKNVNRNGDVSRYPGNVQGQSRDASAPGSNEPGRGSTGRQSFSDRQSSSDSLGDNSGAERSFRRLSRADDSAWDRDRGWSGRDNFQGSGERGFGATGNRESRRDYLDRQRMDDEGGAQNYRDWREDNRAQRGGDFRDDARDERWQSRQTPQYSRDDRDRYQQRDESYQGSGDDRDERWRGQRSTFRKWWQRETPSVADVMTKDVKTVTAEAPIREVVEIMIKEDVGVVPIVRGDGRLFGLVTDRDIVVRGISGGKPVEQLRAQDVASTDIEVASSGDSLSDVIHLMGRQQVRRVPVVDERDRLVGIVSLADIANRADQDEELQNALEKISGRRSFWSRLWR